MTNFSILPNANMQILVETAESLGIKVTVLDATVGRMLLEKNGRTHTVWQKSLGINSPESIEKSRNKKSVTDMLRQQGLPVPENEIEIRSLPDLAANPLPSFPLVVKPTRGEKAHDVYVGIRDHATLESVISSVLNHHDSLLIQPFIDGFNDRLFMLNGQVIGAARRHPPTLTGDNTHTIHELIDSYNQKLLDDRAISNRRTANRLLNWPRLTWHLENQGLNLNTILEKDRVITLYPISNFQAGGSVETIPVANYHHAIIEAAQKAVAITGLMVAGIDIMVKDHRKPTDNNVVFLEINSDPGLRLHEWPNTGTPQPVTAALLNLLFPDLA